MFRTWAREICDDSTKAEWTSWAYREYRRLLDVEMMAVCQIYAEVKLADLPVREVKEARGWLTSTHRDVECAREHIGIRIRSAGERRALLHPPKRRYSHHQQQKRRARVAMFYEARGAGAMSRQQAQGAVDRARLQASRTPEAATELPGSEPGEVSFKGPRDGNKEAVAQRAFMGGTFQGGPEAGVEARCNHRMDAGYRVAHVTSSPGAGHQEEQEVPGGR
jgi:hypothetical protein